MFGHVKVAEQSFQVPLPNSPLLLNYLCFGARFFEAVKVNHRSIYSCFLAKVFAVAMATGLVKTRLENGLCLFKNIQSLDIFFIV